MPYDSIIERSAGSDPLVPEPVTAQIIQELPTQSAVLQLANRTTMSTKTQRQPVLDVLPVAYWVGGDTGLKQTAHQEWRGITLVAEEMAAIVPIPEAYLDDAQVPIWNEVRPRLVEAMGALLDAAVLFGVNKPASWVSPAIVPGAVAAGNVVVDGTGADLAQDVASLGEVVAADGYTVRGFASQPGLQWRLVGLRSQDGVPIYQQNLSGPITRNLYGYPLAEVDNGSWDADEAVLIAGDWSKSIVAIRQDITFRLFSEGVISDDTGAVVLNLMQQDAVALRVTMRVAYASANPATRLNGNSSTRWPFGVIAPTGS